MTPQKEIKKMFDEKMKRQDKTSLSILISWAINNAVNCLSENDKKYFGIEYIENRLKAMYPMFIKLYQEWMLENMPKEDWTKDIPENIVKTELGAEEMEKERFKADNPDIKVL